MYVHAHLRYAEVVAVLGETDAVWEAREWGRVKSGTIAVDGGWRVYSSGPGIYTNLLIRHVLGRHRQWGERFTRPLLPERAQDMTAEWD
jgi:1,2-beta-oligoglucan phosphorylase